MRKPSGSYNGHCAALIRGRDYLAANLDRRPSLREVAAIAGLSPFHFQRRFKACFGVSPLDFLTELKVEAARAKLARTDVPVTDLCFELGYESLGTFSSWFKAHNGISPLAYRRAVRTVLLTPAQPETVWVPQCFAMMFTGRLPTARSKKRSDPPML